MPPRLYFEHVPECPARFFAERGQALLRWAATQGLRKVQASGETGGLTLAAAFPVARLQVCALQGDALLFGRFQRTASAVRLRVAEAEGLDVVRRSGGGRTVLVRGGALGVLLALPHPGILLPRPAGADRLLNRYVRGLNAGLRWAGVPNGSHYLGRDFISSGSRQLGVVSQDGMDGGPVLFEAVVGVGTSLELPPYLRGYPEHDDPRAGGPPWTSLSELLDVPLDFEATAKAIARGYAETYPCELAEWVDPGGPAAEGVRTRRSAFQAQEPPSDAPREDLWPSPVEGESGFTRGGPAQVPIGFVEALVRLEGDRLAEARLRGDFVAPAFVVRGLEGSLAGSRLEFGEIGRRIDSAFRRPGAALHGVTNLRVLADTLMEAGRRPPA